MRQGEDELAEAVNASEGAESGPGRQTTGEIVSPQSQDDAGSPDGSSTVLPVLSSQPR